MYERMLDKATEPTEEQLREFVGEQACDLLDSLEAFLSADYDLVRELKFPFGNHYGWGYKYGHRSKHLCYVFFERGALTVTIQIGDREVPVMAAALGGMLPKTRELWRTRYPCGEQGGWVHYRVLSREELEDVMGLVRIKKAPAKGG